MKTRRKGPVDIDTSIYQSSRKPPNRKRPESSASLVDQLPAVDDAQREPSAIDFPSSSSPLSECDTEIASVPISEPSQELSAVSQSPNIFLTPEPFRRDQEQPQGILALNLEPDCHSCLQHRGVYSDTELGPTIPHTSTVTP